MKRPPAAIIIVFTLSLFLLFSMVTYTAKAASIGTVNATVLNVRAGPGTTYKILTGIKNGQTYNLLDSKNGWYKLKAGSIEGWVSGNYLKISSSQGQQENQEVNPATTNSLRISVSMLNIRKGPSASTSIIGVVKSGEVYNYFEKSGDWVKIKYKSSYGWMNSKYAKILSTGAAAPPQIPSRGSEEERGGTSAEDTITVTADILNVRSGYSTSYPVIGQIKQNSTYKVLGKNSGWFQIQYGSKKGWVSGNYVTINNSGSQNTPAGNGGQQVKNSSGKTRKDYLIVLDAGHGASDPGAVNGKYYEKNFTIDIINRANTILKARGFDTYLTRKGDEYVSLTERVDAANKAKADVFISVHMNTFSPSANGTTTYYGSKLKGSSMDLAGIIQKHLVADLHRKDRGIISGSDLRVLNSTNMPAALLETLFISNSEELKLILDADFRQRAAQSLGNAIDEYFGFSN